MNKTGVEDWLFLVSSRARQMVLSDLRESVTIQSRVQNASLLVKARGNFED